MNKTQKSVREGRHRVGYLLIIADIAIQYACGYFIVLCMVKQFSEVYVMDAGHFTACLSILVLFIEIFSTIFHMYSSIWRYANEREYLMLILQMGCGSAAYLITGLLWPWAALPFVMLAGIVSLSFIMMMLVRILLNIGRRGAKEVTGAKSLAEKGNTTYVAIIGAGNGGSTLLNEMRNNPMNSYIPYCFLDDDPLKIGRSIRGIKIKGGIDRMQEILSSTPVTEVIIAIPSLINKRKIEILDVCMAAKLRVKMLPNILNVIQEGNLSSQMRQVQIEDLLGREAVTLDNSSIMQMIGGQTVLVTGGGGSIGSELCRQIASCKPRQLIIIDIYENNAYCIEQELRQKYGDKLELKVEIASVRDETRINQAIRYYRPDFIYHAAAHKHVPLMENCPQEAIKNNVLGTYNTAKAAKRWGVRKFVLISTDKAVNPTNVMGATKRLCELIVQSMNAPGNTEFCSVRFGNVLGSNGSVVPHFKQQIAAGGPVTITDRRIIRYFMSIPEAAQLVLSAGALAKSGEVFVLDMGEPVKILTLAEKLIFLSGFQPYTEIPIVEIGLRPGEKLYEELLVQKDKMTKTKNNKIFIEKQTDITERQISDIIARLTQCLDSGTNENIVHVLREVVPTFRPAQEVNDMTKDEYRQPSENLA